MTDLRKALGPEAEIGPAVGLSPEEHAAWIEAGKPEDWQGWRKWWAKQRARSSTTTIAAPSVATASTVKNPGTQEQSK